MKEKISMSYGSGISSWKPDIYGVWNSVQATEAPSWCTPMERYWNDPDDRPNQHKNNHKLCNRKVHPLLRLKESQWKLGQQNNQKFLMEGRWL